MRGIRQLEHELAKKIAESAALQGHIPQEKIPIYQYGFELLISSVCSVLFILAIGIVFGHPGHALIYLAGFIPIRVCAGGYHGKTHLECYIVFSIAFALCIWLSLSLTFAQVFPIITGFALLLAMVCFAPVEAKNKPLTPKRRKRNRRGAIILSAVDLLIALVLFSLQFQFGTLSSIYYLSKWTVILFTIWPVAYETLQKLTYVER